MNQIIHRHIACSHLFYRTAYLFLLVLFAIVPGLSPVNFFAAPKPKGSLYCLLKQVLWTLKNCNQFRSALSENYLPVHSISILSQVLFYFFWLRSVHNRSLL